MRHLVLLLSTASAQVRIQYPFGAGPVVVQCPSGDITVTCGEAPVADDPAMGALRQQVVAMEARIARLVDEAGKASVAAAVSATGHVEVASRGKPAPSSAAAELWPPPSAAESALLSRLELTSAQLYSSADLDLSSRHLDDSDSLTLAGLLAARGASGLRALRRLWLSENRIGDEGAAAILAALKAAGGLHGLTALYLTNNHLGPPTARTLADALGGGGGGGGAAELLELNLSENQLGDLGLQLLVEKLSLAPLPKLEELAISDNQLGDAGARALAAALAAGAVPRLRRLLLDHNKLGGGAAALGGALGGAARLASPPLAQLEQLDLSYNLLDDAAASELATGLRESGGAARLQRLWLGSNHLTDEAVVAIAEALESGATDGGAIELVELSLQWNNVADRGAAALAHAVTSGTLSNLQYLYLDNNQIGDDGAVALAKSLKNTGAPVLKELHIWSNHIGDVGRVAFEEALSTSNLP